MYYCGDDFIGSIGNTIEEAFMNYKVNVDIEAEIEDCTFYEIASKSFYCRTTVVRNDKSQIVWKDEL